MKAYFISLGWYFSGMCGCQENKEVFSNNNIPNWQIWISQSGNICQFRKIYQNSMDTTRKGSAGVMNYEQAYQFWVVENRD